MSNLTQDIGAYNQTAGYLYDANGNPTQQSDGQHRQNYTIEAANKRLLTVTDAQQQTLKNYTYDAAGHVTSDGYCRFNTLRRIP